HVGRNIVADTLVESATGSASDVLTMVPIPPDCYVTGGRIIAGWGAGVSSQWILKVGVPGSDAAFGTFTVSGGGELSQNFGGTGAFVPVTISSSGTDAVVPVIVTVNTAPTSATVSLSVFLMVEYVLPGNYP